MLYKSVAELKIRHQDRLEENLCVHELKVTSLFGMAKVGFPSSRKLGILYTNPSIDPDQALAGASGRWE